MDVNVIDFNYGDEKSVNVACIGNPGEISKVVYVDDIKDLGNASPFTISGMVGDEDLNAETINVSFVDAESRQVDLEVLDKVAGHPTTVSDEGKVISDESNGGDFGEVTTKLWENKDKIVFNSGALIPKRRGRENQTEKEGECFVSDLVWGKVRSHPWWPGQILEPSSASDKVMKYFKKDSYLIAYFGDQTFAWNSASQILPFGLYFQQMEKQSREETFKIAVDAALDEVSRHVEHGLVCGCLPKSVLDRVKCQVDSSASIQVQHNRIYYGGNGFPATASFVPTEIVAYLKSLAETPNAAVNRLQFTAVRAQVWAFLRWRGCSQFPAIDKFTGSLENDANPMALDEEELFDAVLLEAPLALNKDVAVAVKRRRAGNDAETTAEGQRKKKQRVLETMPAIRSCLSNGESTYQEGFNWDMTLSSSMKKKRRSNGEISLEKVRKGHLLPMANNEAASMPKNRVDVGKLRRVTGKSKKTYSSESSSKHGRQRLTSQECPPVNEMLSKMVIVAKTPLETCSLLKSVAGFFVNFRNSICLENNSMLRNEGSTDMFDAEHGSELVTRETFKLKGAEDSYWTDKIIENNLEDQVFLEHDSQTDKDDTKQQKAEGMIQNKLEEPIIFEYDEGIVIAEPQGGFDDADMNKDGVEDTNAQLVTSDGDGDSKAMVTAEADTLNAPHIDEKSEEYSPTLLILNFNNLQSIPSIENLNSIFNSYGPLNELDTEILSKSKRAKIVFKRRCDADTAFSSAGKYRAFGPSLISYRLKYLPKTYNAKRRKKNKAPEPEPQRSGM